MTHQDLHGASTRAADELEPVGPKPVVRSAAALLGAMWLMLATGAASADWPQWRGPLRSGASADAGVAPWQGDPPLLWESEPIPSGDAGGYASPVVAGGRVYLYVTWRYEVPLETRTLSSKDLPRIGRQVPDVPADLLAKLQAIQDKAMTPKQFEEWLAGAGLGAKLKEAVVKLVPTATPHAKDVVLCADARSGKTLWKTEFAGSPHRERGIASTPCVVDGRVYGAGRAGDVYCLDAATGRELWKANVGRASNASLAVVEGKVVNVMGSLVALDAATGQKLWEQKNAAGGHGSPAIWRTQNKSYILCNGKDVNCIDPADGKVLWKVPGGGDSTPAAAGDTLAVQTSARGDAGGGLLIYRISPQNAEAVGKIDVASRGCSPIVTANRVYAIGDGAAACVDAQNGKLLWRTAVPKETWSSPLLCGDVLLATVGNQVLLIDGAGAEPKVLARGKIDVAQCTSAAVSAGRLYVRGHKSLMCYDLGGKPNK